jgi:hypothetical protein
VSANDSQGSPTNLMEALCITHNTIAAHQGAVQKSKPFILTCVVISIFDYFK